MKKLLHITLEELENLSCQMGKLINVLQQDYNILELDPLDDYLILQIIGEAEDLMTSLDSLIEEEKNENTSKGEND